MPEPTAMPARDEQVASAKARLRQRLLAGRAAFAQDAGEAAAEAEELAGQAMRLCAWLADARRGATRTGRLTVAGYVSQPGEPGTGPLRQALRSREARVLLPVIVPSRPPAAGARGPAARPGAAVPLPLRWAVDPGDDALVAGPFGIRQPADGLADERLLAGADLVLLPALAVDHTGARLGRGGGFYDRALATLQRPALLVAVVHPDEVLDELPAEPHDRRVDGALTRAGVTWLGNPERLAYR